MRARINVVTLAGDAQSFRRDDLAARSIDDARFDAILVILIVVTIPIILLMAMPFGPAKFLGWILLAVSLALSSIGSAGIAAHLGERMKHAGNDYTPLGAFIRGAVVLELAVFFPIIGWLFVWPLILITAFGATGFALLNWLPPEKTQNTSATSAPANSPISTQSV